MIACLRCGYQNQPTSKFCASCGGPMPAAQAAAGGQAAPAPHAPQQQPPPAQGWGAPPPGQLPHHHPGAPPGWGAPVQQPPAQGAPPGWGQPPQQGGFSPEQARVGQAQQGLNPFGATMAPEQQGLAGYAPPPGHAPGQQHPGQQHPGHNPQAGGYGPPPGAVPGWPAQPHPDPSAFAATAPPPTTDEPPPPDQPPPAPYGVAAPQASPNDTQASVGASSPTEEARRVLAGFLVSYEKELGQAFIVYQGQNTVGRQDAAQGLDIEIDHPTTSSRHAILHASARPGRLQLEDLGSTNGTFKGDVRLDRGVRVELADGDHVRFGGFEVIVKIV